MVILIDAAMPVQGYFHSETYSYTRPLIQDQTRLVEELLDTDFLCLIQEELCKIINPSLPLEVGLTMLTN